MRFGRQRIEVRTYCGSREGEILYNELKTDSTVYVYGQDKTKMVSAGQKTHLRSR